MNAKSNPSHCRLFFVALSFIAFAVTKIHAATPVPENVEWVLVEMNGKAVKAPDGGKWKGATLKLDAKEKLAHGVSFVNLYSYGYDLKDNTLKFGIGKMTAIGSRNRDETRAEEEFHAMLKDVTGWHITDGKLELLMGDKIVARFSGKPEPENAGIKKLKVVPTLKLPEGEGSRFNRPEIHRIKSLAAFKRLGGQDGFAFDFTLNDLVIVRGNLSSAHGRVLLSLEKEKAVFNVEIIRKKSKENMMKDDTPYASACSFPKHMEITPHVFTIDRFADCKEVNVAELLKDTDAEGLNLVNSEVTDADLEKLKEFKNLTHLYLSDNYITDKGLANLSHMKSLIQLYLDGNSDITDAGLVHLKGIMTSRIQILTLGNTSITADGLKQLQEWGKNGETPDPHITHSIVIPLVYE